MVWLMVIDYHNTSYVKPDKFSLQALLVKTIYPVKERVTPR